MKSENKFFGLGMKTSLSRSHGRIKLTEIYCENCGSLLARLDGRAEIKCRKCGRLAVYKSEKTSKNAV